MASFIQDEIRFFFFFQAEDGIRDTSVTGVQTCALPIWLQPRRRPVPEGSHRHRPRGGRGRCRLLRQRLGVPRRQERGVDGSGAAGAAGRSEERRVGKEGRGRGGGWEWKTKKKWQRR